MSRFELFREEQAVVAEVTEALQNGHMDAGEARDRLSALLEHYKKLLRQTQRLIKLSDGNASKLHQRNDQLKQYSDNLEYSASHDALTGLFNKGTITDIIRKQLASGDFVLGLFDIDHFKKVNDTYGHYVGDQVLSGLAKLVRQNIAHKDYLGRFGGEEFIMVLNDTSPGQCLDMAGKLLRTIAQAILADDGELRVSVTVSMGITLVRQHETFEEVYTRADKLLYVAKQNGRNRVECDGMAF